MHPVANAACSAAATPEGVWFEGGRIDAVVRCGSTLLRTSAGASTRVGLAQVRRRVSDERLSVLHVVFAPVEPRPVLFSAVALESHADEPLRVDYTELWDVQGEDLRAEPGACVCTTPAGMRALADAGIAIRAEAALGTRGLALDLALGLPPRARRWLAFAYAAPPPNESPGALVQGWRGEVLPALERTVAHWLDYLGDGREAGGDLVERYRAALSDPKLSDRRE